MATINQILHRKNDSGTYDDIYLKANMSNVTGTLAVANGGTGATSAADARSNLQVPEIGVYSEDMNNLKTPGIYRIQNNVNAPADIHYGQVLSMYGGAGDTYAQLGISHSGNHLMFRGAVDSIGWTDWYNVTGEIDTLKTSVSNGKSAVASAITDKGVSTSATATFATMASNIRSISSMPSKPQWVTNVQNTGDGGTITFESAPGKSLTWLVVHTSNNLKILALENTYETTAFNSSGNNTYNGSTLSSRCANFINTNFSSDNQYWLALQTTRGFSCKAFVPYSEEVNNVWNWYSRGNTYRRCSNAWWTCSPRSGTSDEVNIIYSDGSGYREEVTNAYIALRPHIAVLL